MNTGNAFMTTVRVQRLNSLNSVLYEETLSVLDAFGTHLRLTEFAFSLLSVEKAELRFQDFIEWIQGTYLSTEKVVQSQNSYIEPNFQNCPLPDTDWEIKDSVEVDSVLRRKDIDRVVLSTKFDGIVNFKKSYGLEFRLLHSESPYSELDYHKGRGGELLYRSQIPRKELVFDINYKGELIVIGEDADHYSINELGQLCYTY